MNEAEMMLLLGFLVTGLSFLSTLFFDVPLTGLFQRELPLHIILLPFGVAIVFNILVFIWLNRWGINEEL